YLDTDAHGGQTDLDDLRRAILRVPGPAVRRGHLERGRPGCGDRVRGVLDVQDDTYWFSPDKDKGEDGRAMKWSLKPQHVTAGWQGSRPEGGEGGIYVRTPLGAAPGRW